MKKYITLLLTLCCSLCLLVGLADDFYIETEGPIRDTGFAAKILQALEAEGKSNYTLITGEYIDVTPPRYIAAIYNTKHLALAILQEESDGKFSLECWKEDLVPIQALHEADLDIVEKTGDIMPYIYICNIKHHPDFREIYISYEYRDGIWVIDSCALWPSNDGDTLGMYSAENGQYMGFGIAKRLLLPAHDNLHFENFDLDKMYQNLLYWDKVIADYESNDFELEPY